VRGRKVFIPALIFVFLALVGCYRIPEDLSSAWFPPFTPPASSVQYIVGTCGVNGVVIIDVSDPSDPRLVAWKESDVKCTSVYAKDERVYVCNENGVSILDVSDIEDPVEIGEIRTDEPVISVYAFENFLYTAEGDRGVSVFDTSDPSNPIKLGSFDTYGYSRDILVRYPYLYVADDDGGVLILDVSDPSDPHYVGKFTTLSSSEHIHAYSLFMRYPLLYVGGFNDFTVLDISNPEDPRLVGHLTREEILCIFEAKNIVSTYDISVADTLAFVACGDNGLGMIDVSDPSSPRDVVLLFKWGHVVPRVCVRGKYLYMIRDERLEIFDVTVPRWMYQVGMVPPYSSAKWVALHGSKVYVVCDEGYMVVFDTSDLEYPVKHVDLGSYLSCYYRVYSVCSKAPYLYFIGHCVGSEDLCLLVYDCIEDNFVSSLRFPSYSYEKRKLVVKDHYVLAYNDENIMIFDVSNPASPTYAGKVDIGVFRVYPVGDYLYALICEDYSDYFLTVIDASNPLDMKIVKKIKSEDRLYRLEMNGTYLYTFHENHDLAIFDISEPSSPVPVKTVENFTLGDYVNTAKIVGDYMYMKLSSEQMWIVDVSDPLNPSVVSTLTFKTDIFNIAESDSRLYMASGKEGLVVMDITDFTSPTLVKDLPWLIFNDIAPLE